MSDEKTVLIIEGHPLFRASLQQMLNTLVGFSVVGIAADAREGERLALEQQPDIVLIALSLPDKSGIHLTHTLTALVPTTTIIIVTLHNKIDYIIGALRAGALGYILKDSLPDALSACLTATLANEYYLDTALSKEIVPKLLILSSNNQHIDAPGSSLTPREQEILGLLAQGITTKQIASRLFISAKTVANHRSNIMAKLGFHNSIELVRYAAQLGILGNAL